MLSDQHSSCSIPSITATPSSPTTQSKTNNKSFLNRPTSDLINHKLPNSLETEVLEKWVEDLAQYERTLEEMAKASLDPSFKEELGAVENWFSALSEAEKTSALYSLLHQSTNLQVRFFITVLQKMTKDPMRELLSKGGLQTFGEYSNRNKIPERHSMPTTTKNDIPQPISLGLDYNYTTSNPRMSLKASSYNPEDGLSPGWRRSHSPGHTPSPSTQRITSLDLKGLTSWGLWDNNNTPAVSHERPLSASLVQDANWGNLGKNRNSQNLSLKPEQDFDPENSYPSPRPKPPASPTFPPGLPTTSLNSSRSPTPSELPPSTLTTNSTEEVKDPKPLDPVCFDVLESIPAWMRSLRLHKYTSLFEHMKWQEIITLDDQKLADLGVVALGARRKFLKVFEHIKNEAGIKGISTDIPAPE